MMTTIKRNHIIVLLAACLFAAGSTVFLLHRQPITYQCFKTANGWGYNILAGQKTIIHQPFVPGVAGLAGFNEKQSAAAAAQIVIEKIKSGQMPLISHQQLQRLGVLPAQVK